MSWANHAHLAVDQWGLKTNGKCYEQGKHDNATTELSCSHAVHVVEWKLGKIGWELKKEEQDNNNKNNKPARLHQEAMSKQKKPLKKNDSFVG